MTTDEREALTLTWRVVPWETRDLFARWLAVELVRLGINKRKRIDVQAALLALDGDAQDEPGRVLILRRCNDLSQAELQAIFDGLDAGELAYSAAVGL